MEPLAVDHCAVPDGGEALGGAEHQGVLHPHTGKHLQISQIMSKVANSLKIQDTIQVYAVYQSWDQFNNWDKLFNI